MIVLQHEITRLQNGWYYGNRVWHQDIDKLADLKQLRDTLAGTQRNQLILSFTTRNLSKGLEAFGLVDLYNEYVLKSLSV